MSIAIKMYTFSKHENSTARPTGNGTTFDCLVKTPSSLMTPYIELQSASNPVAYNYAYIADFNRYYFINDWKFDRGLWYASLVVDVLATYKTEIGSSTLYVLRSASSHDGYIRDTLYPTTAKHTTAQTVITETVRDWYDGVYVVNVIGTTGSGVVSYAISVADFPDFYSKVMLQIDGLQWTDVPTAIKNSIVNPLDFITSCFWFPKNVFSGTSVSSIPIGASTISISAKRISVAIPDTYTISIPKHPKTSSYGKYVGLEPYSSYILRFDVITDMAIPAWKLVDETSIEVVVKVDAVTGQAYVNVTGASGNLPPLANLVVGWGVPVALSANNPNFNGMVKGAGEALGGLIKGDPIDFIAGIGDAVVSGMGSISTLSSSGSLSGHNNTKSLSAYFLDVVDRDPTNDGLPLCQMKTLNTLSGFIVVKKGEVEANATLPELARIKSFLESGFYYE